MGFFWNPIGAAQDLVKTGDFGKASNTLLGGWDITGGYNITNPLRSVAPTPGEWKPSTTVNNQTLATDYNSGGGSGGSGTWSGGGSLATSANTSYNPDDLARFDQSIGLVNSSMNRLGGQEGIALGNIDRNYSTQQNELNTGKTNAQRQYDTSSTQNRQNLVSNRNTINDQASQGLRGLQRMLGAYGAVGSDQQLASNAVTDQSNLQRNGAGQTYSQNQQGLDTNWDTFQGEWDNNKRKLDDWKTQQQNEVRSRTLTTKQDLLSKLADLQGQRAALIGGSYTGSAQPYLDQAQGLAGRIDALGRINPTYTGKGPTYTNRPLDSYDTGNAATGSIAASAAGGNSPYLAMLLGQDRERKALF